jgi:IS1 family transposase
MARSFMANACRSTSSCVSSHAWLRDWASGARVFEVDANTVLQWLVNAAEQLRAFARHVLHDIRVQQVQLDELFALLSAVKDGAVSETEAIARLERSPQWVWVALDPESKLVLAIDVGERALALAQRVVHQVAQILAPDCTPLFLTDGFKEYLTALLTHYGPWVQPPRRQSTGPMPKPRWMPRPGLLYAQVIKTVRRRRLVRVRHRVVCGTLEAVQQVLAACGWQINTAFIERLNLSLRQHVAAVGRRVTTLCKGEAGLRQELTLYQVYYNFCLPHTSLRLPLPQPVPTHGTGSAKQWRPCTPAMAAGLTDRSCTSSLRIITLPRKPGKMPPYHTIVKGVRHDSTAIFLPDGRLGIPMDIFYAACCLAQPMPCDTTETRGAHPATAQTLQRAEIVCRPHPQAAV